MLPNFPNQMKIIGLMSGSSLDGIDLAAMEVEMPVLKNDTVSWRFLVGEEIALPPEWKKRLLNISEASAFELARAHADFGHFLGQTTRTFMEKYQLQPDLIASHGHTIFHDPSLKMTCQIGDGAALAHCVGLPVVCDFRTSDIAAGGQGAPAAPIADYYLFPGYHLYLNIGGIANLTAVMPEGMVAFDVGPGNQVFNFLAGKKKLAYDPEGQFARQGQVIPELLAAVRTIPYFELPPPKSIDNNWLRRTFFPLYEKANGSVESKLHTACEHLAIETARQIEALLPAFGIERPLKMMVSGGGAYNLFLLDRLRYHCLDFIELVVPESSVIDFKEALLMALMGAFRISGISNTFCSVTGAQRETCGGAVYSGKPAAEAIPSHLLNNNGL